jgi:outer membrane murein-binding lipoprotein Lpp
MFKIEKRDMVKHNYAKFILAATVFMGGAALAGEHGHKHDNFAKDVDAFHAVLAPVWHARPGPERMQDVCAKAGEMARLANEIRSKDATTLAASTAVLQSSCGNAKGDVDAALHDVHEAFHYLINMRPAATKP